MFRCDTYADIAGSVEVRLTAAGILLIFIMQIYGSKVIEEKIRFAICCVHETLFVPGLRLGAIT